MSTTSINNLSGSYLQSILSSAVQNASLQNTSLQNNALAAPASAVVPADNSQLSPLAKLLSELQQLQQSDPGKYQQVTKQIATNLENAAQTAQSAGNTAAASQLTQLATDFSNASTSGQLPNIQDLAQAIGGGGGHHHHHHGGGESSYDAGRTASPLSSTSSNSSTSLNPLTIISDTLAAAGITPA
jgi:hypothetical protein